MTLPLAGIRVLDLGHEWSCPHTARLLADFGAEVLKIEYLKRLDFMRGNITQDQAYDRQVCFWQVHRNKKSITLDLQEPVEKEIFCDLARIADIVLENSRPGVMDRLGLGYDCLKQLNSQIILISMSAFGRTGPESAYGGYGGSIEAISGIQSLTAYESDAPPRRIKEMDVTNGIAGACAAMTALLHRQVTGEGEWIDLSETESATHALIGEHFLELAVNGTCPQPIGNRHPEYAPQGCYPCSGEDRWMVISVTSDDQWQAFCKVIDHTEWATDERFTTQSARQSHHDELDLLIESWTSQQDPRDATHCLQTVGIAAGPVLDMADLCADPHLEQREYFQTPTLAPEQGRFLGFPFRLSKGDGCLLTRSPDLGDHNHSAICELLGRPQQQIPSIVESELGTSVDSD
jgi:crotonobetainyl-CoA:carnitine CoA-transferase CaiB-like acyl-CoA transferase